MLSRRFHFFPSSSFTRTPRLVSSQRFQSCGTGNCGSCPGAGSSGGKANFGQQQQQSSGGCKAEFKQGAGKGEYNKNGEENISDVKKRYEMMKEKVTNVFRYFLYGIIISEVVIPSKLLK